MTIPDFNRSMPKPESLQQILDTFDQGVATVKAVLPTFNDQRMQDTWKMIKDGKEVLAVPRAGMLRNILLNHWYHHRGQFGVYLRMLGARVPSSYGPSGDEPPAFLQAS